MTHEKTDGATKETVLVTGGAGFIGRWLVKKLLALGNKVIIIDNFSNGDPDNIAEFDDNTNCIFVQGDVTREDDVAKVFADNPTKVFHLAAQINVQESLDNPPHAFKQNLVGTYNVLEECRKRNIKIIVMGTCMVYDLAGEQKISEKHLVKPASPYAGSKVGAEELALSYHFGLGLPVVIVRPFNTYGPFQKSNMEGGVISIFVNNYLQGKDLNIYGDGTQTRDLLYVEDCTDFLIRAGEVPAAVGHVINAGTGSDITINDLAKQICPDESRIKHVPHIHPQSEIAKLCCDSTKARQLLNWEPKTTLAEGIEKMKIWLQQKNANKNANNAIKGAKSTPHAAPSQAQTQQLI